MAHKRLPMAVLVTDKGNVKKQQHSEKTVISKLLNVKPAGLRNNRSKHPETGALVVLIAFVLLNIGCVTLLSWMPMPSEQIRNILGHVPPIQYLNIACALFVVTEIILTLCRNGKNLSAFHACKQFVLFAAFYLFYWAAGVMEENFIPLFFAGIVLLTSEYLRLLNISKTAAKTNVAIQR